ncbi:tetratricopeptide repeat protein [Sorangium sp. So ce1036]|uniref:tetratricopeptide repeat protein n=1 Tax=Sorangium sp. So ce1036 TaxID=3133328 RepID=UPI003F077A5D
MPRHRGPRAEEAYWRARVDERRAAGDAQGEREATLTLARLLAARGVELDRAAALARRALSLGDDPAMRSELAGWLAGLGEPALAAAALRGIRDDEQPAGATARMLVKIAVLLARASDVAGAVDALKEASELAPDDAMASELLGTIATWASDEVPPEAAARAYLEAARRREAGREREAAFEDRLRAFEIAPHDDTAAKAMAAALFVRGRLGAADEVLRAHAEALAARASGGAGEVAGRSSLQRAMELHGHRLQGAMSDGDWARAVGCVLDAGLEADVDGEAAGVTDEVLEQAGLYELVAARLELRAERRTGAARAEAYAALARLYAGPLASPDRAVEAWIEAAASDRGNAAARSALREHAAALHDMAPLVEALIRVGEGSDGRARDDAEGRIDALWELAGLAEEKIGDPGLARWALDTLKGLGADPARAAAGLERVAGRLKAQDEALLAAQRALAGADTAEGKIDALRRLVVIYRGRPEERAAYEEALVGLAQALPTDRGCLLALDRLSRRTGGSAALEALLRARLSGGARAARGEASRAPSLTRVDRVRARLLLAAIDRRLGRDERALDDLLPLLVEAPGHRGAASAALVLATRTGRARGRADAMVQLAAPAWPALRAVLLALAAALYDRAGAAPLAREAAVLACEADPSCARAVATLASILTAELAAAVAGPPPFEIDRAIAAAIERSITAVFPRGALCDGLAKALEALGELPLALAWTQRWLALRPGSPQATAELIRRAAIAGDASRLSDALAWILAQPKPLGEMAAGLASALHALYDLDPERGTALARRSLDVFGPQDPLLRERLLELARRAGDPELAITVLERWLAAEITAPHAVELMFMLADCRLDGGDADGAALELARAAEAGADPQEILSRIQRLEAPPVDPKGLSSDCRIALARARARALTARGDDAAEQAAAAWRELGSLLWDLAEDHRGAEDALFRASELAPSAGVERYARDMCELAGFEAAIEAILARAAAPRGDRGEPTAAEEGRWSGDVGHERRRRASLLIEAANLAHEHGLSERALAAAASAIELDPLRADAVALVEKSADAEGGVAVLDRTYRLLAGAALGCYGRRAAHYRAARQLERRGAYELALSHAVASFEAVPTEGTSYVLLARLAEHVGEPSEAVRAIERVAATVDPSSRNAWLKRAAALTGRTEEGLRLRLDILLRAMVVRPDPAIVEDVGAAIRDLIACTGEPEVEAIRFDRAVKASLTKLDGPDGARAGIAMARIAVEVLDAPALALAAIERAMLADGDVDEFMTLLGIAGALARETEPASHLIAAVYAAAMRPHSSVGPGLLRWASKLAAALNVPPVAAALLVEAARRAPEDDALAYEAEASVEATGDEALKRSLDDALPVTRRVEALLHLADKHERDGERAEATVALERALASGKLHREGRVEAVTRLRRLYAAIGRGHELESLVRAELARVDLPDAVRLEMTRELAAVLAARGDLDGALELLVDVAQETPFDKAHLDELIRLARRTDDRRRLFDVLTLLQGACADDGARLLVLRELAPLAQELGERGAAAALYEAIARLDPADMHALEILEQDASERGDHAAVAALLARRIEAAPLPDTRRALRLRRAALLEQRLGLLDEACAELSALLDVSPDDVSALRFLADIHERLGTPLRAAPLWCRLGDLATTTDERAEYNLRACSSYLAGGDVESARDTLESVARIAPREAVIELRVEIARREGDGHALAAALDQLASASRDAPERRAQLLVEAAHATSSLGDDVTALERARRAVKLAPDSPDAVLEARRIEYRLRGTGTPRDAQAAVEELGRIAPRLRPAHVDLHAFLLAETLDVIQGHGAGMRELTRRHAEVGPSTLVALGMAERLALKRNFSAALPLFERALGGDLQGMRARGRVALAAAETAQSAGDLEAAARLLEEAAAEPETRALALRRQLELTAARGEPEAARRALEELVAQSSGIDRARALMQLARLFMSSDPDRAAQILSQATALAGSDRSLGLKIAELNAELASERATLPPEEVDRAAPHLTPAAAPVQPPSDAPPSSRPAVSGGAPASSRAPLSGHAPTSSRAPLSGRAPASGRAPLSGRAPASGDAPASSGPRIDLVELSDPLDESLAVDSPRSAVVEPPEEDLLDAPELAAPELAAAPAEAAPGAVDSDERRGSVPASPSSAGAPGAVPLVTSPASIHPPSSATRLVTTWPPSAAESFEEAALFRELAAGAYDAGERLMTRFAQREDRSREALAVRRMQAHLRLGDRGALERLQAAAIADKNMTYARAIEHVLRAFEGDGDAPSDRRSDGFISPPLLAAQRDAPELVSALLFRDLEAPASEALAIVWETGLFRRDTSQAALSGAERVQPTSPTLLGEIYGVVAGHLGLLRTALYHQRAPSPAPSAPEGQIIRLSPPAVLLRGEVRDDTPELRFMLGAHLAGAMPEHVLANTSTEDELRTLLSAVVAAFGPLEATAQSTRGNPAVVRLEQNLWQLIPPRAERRLREICDSESKMTYEGVMKTTRTAMRRAGLFAAGDLATAIRATIRERGLELSVPLSRPDGLAAACAAHPEIADLVRLATRMEYAEARWQPGTVPSLRRIDSGSSRFRAGT